MPASDDRSPLRLFFQVCRKFGLATGIRVVFFRLRGLVFPARALPDPMVPDGVPHQISILVSAAEQGADTLEMLAGLVAHRQRSDWELCVCAHAPLKPSTSRALARRRGTHPCFRVVEAKEGVDAATAAQWTVEQATGEMIALLGTDFTPPEDAFARLLSRLRADAACDAAVLIRQGAGSDGASVGLERAECLLFLQRKSNYLAAFDRRWALTAGDAAGTLARAAARLACEPWDGLSGGEGRIRPDEIAGAKPG
jgi:hypothetical protein